ncbi:PIN domain-like protein, partial [Metschnikowia bicuspidata]
MGVTNLLPQLKDIQQQVSLTHYKGKTLAVDAYGWLHRGLILCAQDLCLNQPTQGYITSVMKKIHMLRDFGVEPYVVFDGASLPTKEMTAHQRREKRRVALEAANKYLKVGNRGTAFKEFMKAAGVTPEMAKAVMVELDRMGVKYVVAPYEADPQMVYLEKIGLVDGILSEDSDLLIFGCRKLITKLNDKGTCVEIDRANLPKLKAGYHKFTGEQWRCIAILSGCDYTKGIPGVGMKTAYNLVLRNGTWEAICKQLEAERKPPTQEYLQEAQKANLAFQFPKVFNPVERRLTTLNEYPAGFAVDMELVELYCGRKQSPEIQMGVCLGKLHPSTHQPLFSREVLARTGRLNSQTGKMPAATNPRTLGEFYNVLGAVVVSKETVLFKGIKNEADKSVKLSPNAKKLKRLQPLNTNSVPVSSKFFAAQNAKVMPLRRDLANIDFLTGDSEVPDESSSPIKDAPGEATAQYLTDQDNDDSSPDDGYENELEESPIKFTNVVKSWRSQFLMKESAELVSSSATTKLNIKSS